MDEMALYVKGKVSATYTVVGKKGTLLTKLNNYYEGYLCLGQTIFCIP